MKNIKWHQFALVAFLIWMVNYIVQIKLQDFRPYLVAMVLFVVMLFSMSCSSNKFGTNKARIRVERMVNPKPQYAFYNNQIIIFENNY